MIKHFLWLILLLYVLSSQAQQAKIDSILVLLKKYPSQDSIQVDRLNLLAFHYTYINPKKTKIYSKKALYLAKKLHYQKGLMDGYRKLAFYYKQKANFPKAIFYHEKSLKIAQQRQEPIHIASAWTNIAAIYNEQGMYELALNYYNKSIKVYKKESNFMAMGIAYFNMGNTYNSLGKAAKALECYLKSLKITEEINDLEGSAFAYQAIGNNYLKQKAYEKAEECFKKDLEISQKLKSNRRIGLGYISMGNLYEQKKIYTIAEQYYTQALYIFKKYEFRRSEGLAYSNIAQLYSEKKQFFKAIENQEKAFQIFEEINAQADVAESLQKLANTYHQMQRFGLAKEKYQQALKITYQITIPERRMHILKGLYETDSLQRNLESALIHLNQYIHLKDSLFTQDKEKKIQELAIQYETEKKEQAIEKQKLSLEKKEILIQQRNVQIYALLATGSLFLISAFIFYQSKQKEKRANALLIRKNKEIINQKEEISTQTEEIRAQSEELKITNERLKELDGFKQSLTTMIVHDLKNPLNAILGLAKNAQIKQIGQQMLNMVLNILDVQKFEETIVTLDSSEQDLYQLIQDAVQQVEFLLSQKNQEISISISHHITAWIDYNLILRVFVNLLTNAIKYTPTSGTITISVTCPEGQTRFIKISVTDTGQGIPKDKQALVFKKFGQLEAKSSGGIRSTGLGLTFCKMVVEAHQGNIDVESELEQGATFWFTLPLTSIEEVAKRQHSEQSVSYLHLKQQMTDLLQSFTLSEQNVLNGYKQRLRKYEVYEVSRIMDLLREIETQYPHTFNHWIKEIENCVYTSNEELYAQLLNIEK